MQGAVPRESQISYCNSHTVGREKKRKNSSFPSRPPAKTDGDHGRLVGSLGAQSSLCLPKKENDNDEGQKECANDRIRTCEPFGTGFQVQHLSHSITSARLKENQPGSTKNTYKNLFTESNGNPPLVPTLPPTVIAQLAPFSPLVATTTPVGLAMVWYLIHQP